MTFKLLVYSGAVAFKLLELCGNPPVGCATSPLYTRGPRLGWGRAGFLFRKDISYCFLFMRPLAAMKKGE